MTFKLLDGTVVQGDNPIIIIGPNGVGKTRLSVSLAKENRAERIAALRAIELEAVPMQLLEQAEQEVKNLLNQLFSAHWRQSAELQHLMAEIVEEDRRAAVTYRELKIANPNSDPPDALTNTRLKKITTLWNRSFPSREIKLDHRPEVVRTVNGKPVKYSTSMMSEGERTALYMIARVVSCKAELMVVDEPETFFHPLLARQLWNELEALKPTIRFIYVTHDIPFALSRRNAQFVVARSETKAEVLPSTVGIPAEIVSEVLGAASFSVSASRLIFCEGEQGGIDQRLLSAWYDCPQTAVIAVGGCNAVHECVSVFRAGKATTGVEAYGHTDRDQWPDSFLTRNAYITPLQVSEIEGLLCLQPVFTAFAKYYGIEDPKIEPRYQEFISSAKSHFKGVTFNREVLNRARARVELEQTSLLNSIKPDADMSKIRDGFSSVAPAGGWDVYLQSVFDEEHKRLTDSLGGTFDRFLQDFPAKSYRTIAAQKLDVELEAMIRDFCAALRLPPEKGATEIRQKLLQEALVNVLSPSMWPRKWP
jgi:ABC-type dipeptide/oligopeptide/nickel transport system ATPase subunit